MLRIPERQIYRASREQSAFYEPQEQPTDDQTRVVLANSCERSYYPPRRGDEGDPSRRTYVGFQDQVRGQFGEDVGYEEQGDGGLVLVSVQVEVGFEAVEAGVADVDTGEE